MAFCFVLLANLMQLITAQCDEGATVLHIDPELTDDTISENDLYQSVMEAFDNRIRETGINAQSYNF